MLLSCLAESKGQQIYIAIEKFDFLHIRKFNEHCKLKKLIFRAQETLNH
jgi:hypothetical protein